MPTTGKSFDGEFFYFFLYLCDGVGLDGSINNNILLRAFALCAGSFRCEFGFCEEVIICFLAKTKYYYCYRGITHHLENSDLTERSIVMY